MCRVRHITLHITLLWIFVAIYSSFCDVVIKHLNIYSLDVHYKMELKRIINIITLI